MIHLPPYELEHVELDLDINKELSVYVAIVDAVLWCWCCRPQSLSIISNFHSIDFEEMSHVVKVRSYMHSLMKFMLLFVDIF